MSGVDENVVQMTFDNGTFETKLGETIKSLDNLTQSLKFQGAQEGFRNISAAADHVNLSSMASALDNISGKFSAMGAIGFTVISNLTTSALNFAKTAAEKVLDPIMSGGRQRAINLDNAKFAFQGLGIDVQAAMDSALAAVRGTAFGLDEAAKAAAQFGASGIGAGADMTQALRGIAGVAAMTNRSFGEIADIFTSSAATGKVTNMDLQQFATRGLNASAALAKGMGKTEAQIHEMATAGTLDFATFSKVMDDTFGVHAQEADKTFTGALGNMHAALSRLGAAFYIPQLENQRKLFNALSPVIDKVKASLDPLLGVLTFASALKTNRIVDFLGGLDFTKLEVPMKNFAAAFANILGVVQDIMTPLKQAFTEIFPINAGETLLRVSEAVKNFTEHLRLGGETVTKVREVFYGLFSIIDIGWSVLKGVLSVIGDVVKAIAPAGGGFLTLAANLGENLRMLDAYLVSGGKIKDFFDTLGSYVVKPIAFLRELGNAIADMFKSFSGSDVADSALGRVNSRIEETKSGVEKIQGVWQDLLDRFSGVINVLDRVWNYIRNWFAELGQKLAAAFHPGDFNSAVDLVNVGLLGGITLMLKKFLDGGLKLDFSGGLIAQIKTAFGQLTTTLKAMQTDLKADALEKIAIAIGVLTASLVVLSLIDSASLTKALTAMAVGFGEMVGVMTLIDKLVSSNTAAVKLGIIGAALIEFATAAAILSLAIRNLSGLSWDELATGLAGVAGGLVIMVVASKFMGENSLSMIAAGVGMTAISVGLLVMAGAVKAFSTLSWGDLAKGLTGVAGGLALVTLALNFMPASGAISGIGFVEIAVGLTILAGAVALFGQMDWSTMGKGLLGITGALLIITAALDNMPLSTPITAAGLLILAAALVVMSGAVKLMGSIPLGELAKGIGAITVLLLILDAAMQSMQGALPGAAALIVVSGALVILSGVMKTLGQMDTGDLVKSLLALAGVMTVLGLAALIMEPIIPALMGLGVAIALIGGGFALFGAGVWLVANGLTALAESGASGAKALVEMLKTVETAIPEVLGAVIKGFVDQANELLQAAPLLVRLITAVLDQLLDTIIQLAPKIAKALIIVITEGLKLLREKYPDLVETGFEMLLALLKGIRDNIGGVVTLVAEIVINFLDALRKKVPEIITAVYALWITILTEVAGQMAHNLPVLFVKIGIAIINGLLTGLEDAAGQLFEFFVSLPAKLLDIIKAELGIESPSTKFMDLGVNIILGLLQGLVGAVEAVLTWFTELPINILLWIGDAALLEVKGIEFVAGFLFGIVQKAAELEIWWLTLPFRILAWIGDVVLTLLPKGIDVVSGFLAGIVQKAIELEVWWVTLPLRILLWIGDLVATLLPKGIELVAGFLIGIGQKEWELASWFIGLAGAVLGWIGNVFSWLVDKGVDLITGFLAGITQSVGDLFGWLRGLPGMIIDNLPNPFEMLKDIGAHIIEGLINGIGSMAGALGNKIKDMAGSVIGGVGSALGISSPSRVMHEMGIHVGQGFTNGILAMAKSVHDASRNLSQRVVDGFDSNTTVGSINRVLNEIVKHLDGIHEFQPVIRPVLDLTHVKMGAKDIPQLFANSVITPVASFDHARTISTAEVTKTRAEAAVPTAPNQVTFNQYNHSPEALSTNDIYRHTKSQIALAKEELGIAS